MFRWYSEDYEFFYVENESQYYTLRTSQTALGDAGDAINSNSIGYAIANGMPFSSRDADNDQYSGNCATSFGGGWWYSACGTGSLLGDSLALSNRFMRRGLDRGAPAGIELKACLMLVMAVG